MHELFIKVFIKYNERLIFSIEKMKKKKELKIKPRKNFYNYLILNAKPLHKLLESFDGNGLFMRAINNDDLLEFKNCLLYIGKGNADRKYKHLIETKSYLEGKMGNLNKISAKITKLSSIWNAGNGLIILQIFSDSDHYLSLCRENSMIKAAGRSLTNLINGSIYGLMKTKWTQHEIRNYGEMLLYFAFKQCLYEHPDPIFSSDIKIKKSENIFEPKKYNIKTNYKFNGIMDWFLDL